MNSSMSIPVHERIVAVLIPLAAIVAAVGCFLPWERLVVLEGGDDQTTSINAFHGSGIAACAGVTVALLACAHRLWWPGQRARLGDGAITTAGVMIAAGTAFYTLYGGYPPSQGEGFAVRLGAGLVICAACGVVLAAAGLIRLLSAPPMRSGQR
jgi:hypothetical protein